MHTDATALRADSASASTRETTDPRWGLRMPLETLVEVDAGDGVRVPAVVKNASYSGAYLCTSGGIAPSVRMYVHSLNAVIEAFVARLDADGVGVEARRCRTSAISVEQPYTDRQWFSGPPEMRRASTTPATNLAGQRTRRRVLSANEFED